MGRPKLPRVTRSCEGCGSDFQAPRWSDQRFCGRPCSCRAASPRLYGAANPRYNGGLCCYRGRWIVCCRDGSTIAYARVVMEGLLGRHLTSAEIVHHVNGDTEDDRIENLRLTTRAGHVEIHREELRAAFNRALASRGGQLKRSSAA